MAEPVFVDASAWIAIMYRYDENHAAAAAIYKKLLDENVLLLVSNWTAYEAYTFIKSRSGISKARKLEKKLNDPTLVLFERISYELERNALGIFWKYADKTWGVVDCSSLVLMKKYNCKRAFVFDRHFLDAARQFGFYVEKP